MVFVSLLVVFFFLRFRHHRDLHVLTHPFPTRRSSDLPWRRSKIGRSVLVLAGLFPVSVRTASFAERGQIETVPAVTKSEEQTFDLQPLMRTSNAVSCLKKKNNIKRIHAVTYRAK